MIKLGSAVETGGQVWTVDRDAGEDVNEDMVDRREAEFSFTF